MIHAGSIAASVVLVVVTSIMTIRAARFFVDDDRRVDGDTLLVCATALLGSSIIFVGLVMS